MHLQLVQPAVVAAASARPEEGSVAVRLTLPPGVSSTFHENDMMLLSRDNPEVRSPLLSPAHLPPAHPAICPPCHRPAAPALPAYPCNTNACPRTYPPSTIPHMLTHASNLLCHRRSVAMRCTMPWESWRDTRGISPLECASGSPTQRRRGTSTACRGTRVLGGCVWTGRASRQESLHYPDAPLLLQAIAADCPLLL